MSHHKRTIPTKSSLAIASALGLLWLPNAGVTRAYAQSGSSYSASTDERSNPRSGTASAFEQGYWDGRDFERRHTGTLPRSERTDQRSSPDSYDRGYRLGRDTGNRQAATATRPDQQVAGSSLAILLIERDRQTQAMQQVRQSLQQARSALKHGDQGQAEQAIGQADDTVQRAVQGADGWKQIDQALDKAGQSLDQNDRDGAERAIKDARRQLMALKTSRSVTSGSDAGKVGAQDTSAKTSGSGSTSSDSGKSSDD